MLRVGAVSYINALPLLEPVRNLEGVSFTLDHPSKINRLLAQGALDIALISSESYLKHKSEYELLEGLGIGATKEVLSVCLYTRVKKEKLGGKQIAIPNASETSVKLLEILCRCFWDVEPEFTVFDVAMTKEDALHEFAGYLLIGDSCLMHDKSKDFERIDLARAWHKETKKPFVFAVFAARKDCYHEKEQEITSFMNTIKEGRFWEKEKLSQIVAKAQERVNIGSDDLYNYFQTIDYELTKEHYQGLALFDSLHQQLKDRHAGARSL
jgi:chorismate dehydratase